MSEYLSPESSEDDIKSTLLVWLRGFDLSVEQKTTTQASWVLIAKAKDQSGFGVAVIREMNQTDRIVLQSTQLIDQERQNKLAQLDSTIRDILIYDIRVQLLNMEVDFSGVNYPLQSINFARFIFSDNFNRTALDNAISQIRKSWQLVLWMLDREFSRTPLRPITIKPDENAIH